MDHIFRLFYNKSKKKCVTKSIWSSISMLLDNIQPSISTSSINNYSHSSMISKYPSMRIWSMKPIKEKKHGNKPEDSYSNKKPFLPSKCIKDSIYQQNSMLLTLLNIQCSGILAPIKLPSANGSWSIVKKDKEPWLRSLELIFIFRVEIIPKWPFWVW